MDIAKVFHVTVEDLFEFVDEEKWGICNGYFHDERWPYLRELYEMFQHDYMQILPDMNRYGEYFATNQESILFLK